MDEGNEGQEQEIEEEAVAENMMEENEFEGDEKIIKETGIKLALQSDIIAPQFAKKSNWVISKE